MKRLYALLLLVCLAATPTSPLVAQEEAPARALKVKRLTDAQIKKLLIQASIDEYPGNCPCPYNQASNGSRCGKRSAWSREGGYSPLCYPADVTAEMVQAYRTEVEAVE
jgi:hypothetical protein